MTPERRAALRAIAEAATQKRWTATPCCGNHAEDVATWGLCVGGPMEPPCPGNARLRAEDATHIAAFDPPTVLELLAENERLTKALERIRDDDSQLSLRALDAESRDYATAIDHIRQIARAALEGRS